MSESLSPASRLIPAATVRARLFDGELVLLDLRTGEYYALKDAGVVAWQGVSAGLSLGAVSDEIAKHYDVDVTTAVRDVMALGREWIARGLVQLEGQG